MKVILLKDVRKVGMHNEIKEVSDGYAINFLFRQKLAVPATEEKIKEYEAQRAAREAQAQKEAEQLDAKVASLRGKSVTMTARATEKGGLFKSITAADVAKGIRAEHSLEIAEDSISLAAPVKTIGEHKAMVTGKAQKAELLLIIKA